MKKLLNRKNKKGFTIVELVIVIGVIGILSAILIPTFTNLTKDAKDVALQRDLVAVYTEYSQKALQDDNVTYVGQTKAYISTATTTTDAQKANAYYYYDSDARVYKADGAAKSFSFVGEDAAKSTFTGGYVVYYVEAEL